MLVLRWSCSNYFNLVFLECGHKSKSGARASLAKRAMTNLSYHGLSSYAISNRTAQASAFVY